MARPDSSQAEVAVGNIYVGVCLLLPEETGENISHIHSPSHHSLETSGSTILLQRFKSLATFHH